eukprot:TRINITY_DN6740_c0_g1_i1.p1 TRINITY_DN6740_c0_g1~~TRINITY_DN6740_c0_g1_i1.p1  ORF type:complete len:270 (+),score=53.20 TRINITY_DN6740_c0_g1_i1:212-1021(+)
MILGKGFFVTPSDSVAVIAAHAQEAIPYFADGVKGVARSMPTSQALDRVAAKKGFDLFETPTGWKFFGNLMNAGMISICGEESFGTGSDHVREKDGLWAVLSWMSILAVHNKQTPEGSLIGVETIVRSFWDEYGRVYYQRFDYEAVENADRVMADVIAFGEDYANRAAGLPLTPSGFTQFCYHDPVDKSVSNNQGLILNFTGEGITAARAVWRLSGTGSSGATIRLYLEVESTDGSMNTRDACGALAQVAVELSKIQEHTGRSEPTVIT